MSYTPLSDTFRLVSIDICGTSIPDPTGGSIDSAVGWIKSRPGTRVSPATAPDSYDCSAVGIGYKPFTPPAVGTAGDAVFTLEEIGLGTVALTAADMLSGAFKARMSQKPHEFELACEHNAGDTEDVSNISVS